MPRIAISYRRSDSSAIAGRMFDRLAAHYGAAAIFMDIDNIPFGKDFRTHVREILAKTEVLIAVIGANWTGAGAGGSGGARIMEAADPVRIEIQTARANEVPIIPVLVDGATMPASALLPAEFGNFAYLNAVDVASGRDFNTHMNRLIGAIEQVVGTAVPTPTLPLPERQRTASDSAAFARAGWRAEMLYYFFAPLILLLVAHHVIVNALDLKLGYLWASTAAIPFAFGFAFFWLSARRIDAATAIAVPLGVLADAGMTISQGLNSGDPILPQTRFEWLDNAQFVGLIVLGFLAGNVLARAVRALQGRKFKRS